MVRSRCRTRLVSKLMTASAHQSSPALSIRRCVALANLRERLQSRYGDEARFELLDVGPGTLARITLPFEAEATRSC